MRALGATARLRFEEASIALLRKEFPSTTAAYSDEVLRRFVKLGIDRARAYRVLAVSDVERWLRLMVRLGPKFDEDPRFARVQAILSEPDADAQQRMDAIEGLAAQLGQAHK